MAKPTQQTSFWIFVTSLIFGAGGVITTFVGVIPQMQKNQIDLQNVQSKLDGIQTGAVDCKEKETYTRGNYEKVFFKQNIAFPITVLYKEDPRVFISVTQFEAKNKNVTNVYRFDVSGINQKGFILEAFTDINQVITACRINWLSLGQTK